MSTKRFTGKNLKEVFKKIKEMVGPDAEVVSQKTTDNGVEVVVALSKTAYQQRTSSEIFQEFYRGVNSENEHAELIRNVDDDLPPISPILPKPPAKISDEEIVLMREKIQELYGIVGDMHTILKDHFVPKKDMMEQVKAKLLDADFYPKFIEQIVQQSYPYPAFEEQWQDILTTLSSSLLMYGKSLAGYCGNLLFLGPSGSGKTTLLLKILMQHLQQEEPSVAVISLQPQLTQQAGLAHFCSLAGVPYLQLDGEASLEQAKLFARRYDLILTDAPATLDFNDLIVGQYLNQARYLETIYCVPATVRYDALAMCFNQLKPIVPRLAVIMKEDESPVIGQALSFIADKKLLLVGICGGCDLEQSIFQLGTQEFLKLVFKEGLSEYMQNDYGSTIDMTFDIE